MATVTYKKCDHCDIEANRSGVGEGNVVTIYATITRGYENGPKLIEHGADLCCDCEKELMDAVRRWMNPKGAT
jgi:hypothetical protein